MKRWLLGCLIFLILSAVLFMGINADADPFGFFEYKLKNWHATSKTANPLTVENRHPVANHQEFDVPILYYHNIADTEDGFDTVSAEMFTAHMAALKINGYTAVSLEDLISYVNFGRVLPAKPVVITFDDGYLSNYEQAFPILKQFDMKATIFVIGSSMGHTKYKDTAFEIMPHFSYAQAKEMSDSGIISIQSHTYDMHQSPEYEPGQARENILKWSGEDEAAYNRLLRSDFLQSRTELENATGKKVFALAYPHGMQDARAQDILWEMGVRVTLTTNHGISTVIKGCPQSLLGMSRLGIDETVTTASLLSMVQAARG